ncbi:MAG: hypothetical protein IJ064_05415 [Bacteroidaceae bacterium]|nr:hypothetical protein [Bacteroidaceae bacterium]
MEKVFGATERHDSIIGHGTKKAVLIFGYGEENGMGYDYRHTFSHKPTLEEVLEVITDHVNECVQTNILEGFVFEECKVWLTSENQLNYNNDFDTARETDGASLPVIIKLEREGHDVFRQFDTIDELREFVLAMRSHITSCLADGWEEKKQARETFAKFFMSN